MNNKSTSPLAGRFTRQTTLKVTAEMEMCINRIAILTNQTKAAIERQFLADGIENFRMHSEERRSVVPPLHA